MTKNREYHLIGGPQNGQSFQTSPLGRIPTALNENLEVVRVDRADMALGTMARTGKPCGLYLRIGNDKMNLRYAWVTSASLLTAKEA